MMSARKIFFEDEDDEFMKSYKEASGISIQKFITTAVKEKIANVKAEQAIRDQEFMQNGETFGKSPLADFINLYIPKK